MKFIVDCMLGKLAKWLKILGFDVLYFSKIEDERVIILAREESRILLTRDTTLLSKAKNVKGLFVTSENWKIQLHQVLNEFDLWKQVKPYSRCIACNAELKYLTRKRAKNLVTPFVYEHARSFALCGSCGRVYWKGTHYKDMSAKLNRLLRPAKTG